MNRRQFLVITAGGALATWPGVAPAAQARGRIHTVTGPVRLKDLGVTLMHEHVLVDFIGADKIGPGRYDPEEAFRTALPRLEQIRKLGCRTFVECTPAYLGRDPRLLRRLVRAAGLRILTNTGYYGAQNGKFLPPHARTETAEQLAARWIAEWERGIADAQGPTGIRPGLLKTSVNRAPLSEMDAKLVRAAALTHQATGLTIASHTGEGAAAMEELEILKAAGAPAGAFIWVHAQNEKDGSYHLRAAERGAWVEFDGVREATLERHMALVEAMAARGLLGRLLVSQDSGWYRVGEPGGGNFRTYDFLFTHFVPEIRERLGEKAVHQLLVDNPARALA